jgi:hypothetical protein
LLHCVNHLQGIGRSEPKYLYLRFDLFIPEVDIGTMQRTNRGAEEMTVRTWLPIYEGDSIIHYGATGAASKVSSPASVPAKPSLWAAAGHAVAGFFRWLEKGAERARYRQLERYLAESGDVFELERRMRKVELRYGATIDPYS